MKTYIATLTFLLAAVSAGLIEDQPLNGVSEPSKFATQITPELGYTPKL